MTDNTPVQIYTNKIKKRIVFFKKKQAMKQIYYLLKQ